MIVASILMAFGVEAWWGARQDTVHREALLEDLASELSLNRDALESTLERQRIRATRIEALLSEVTPAAIGLPPDSVEALQRQVLLNPTYDPGFGVLNLLLQSGDLALLDDRVLRTRLAGLEAFLDDYIGNQDVLLQLLMQPAVVFNTGSVVFDNTAYLPDDVVITTATPDVRETAVKYFSATLAITELLVGQGETLLAELDSILSLLGSP